MLQTYIIYETADPFPGYIKFYGNVDMSESEDGTTIRERIQRLLDKYPSTRLYLVDRIIDFPDREKVKFDARSKMFVPLSADDITPRRLQELKKEKKEREINEAVPSWSVIGDAFDNIERNVQAAITLEELKAALIPLVRLKKKLAKVSYWLSRSS